MPDISMLRESSTDTMTLGAGWRNAATAGVVLNTSCVAPALPVNTVAKMESVERLSATRVSNGFVLMMIPPDFPAEDRVPALTHELTFFQTKTDCKTAWVPGLSPCAIAVMR